MKQKFMKRIIAKIMVVSLMLPMISFTNVKAENPSAHGLLGEYYKAREDGGREDLTRFDFDEARYLGSHQVANLDNLGLRDTIAGFIGNGGDEQFVSAKYRGKLEIPAAGDYTFYMTGDDGFRLFIDNKLVIDFWVQQWEKEQTSSPVPLESGKHDIRIEYLQGWGGAFLDLKWSGNATGAAITKQPIPESALYLPDDIYYKESLRKLEVEIKNTGEIYDKYKESHPTAQNMKTALDAANEMIVQIDPNVQTPEEIGTLASLHITALSQARVSFYKTMGVQDSSIHKQFYNPLYQGQDPFVTQKDGYYYLVSSSNDDNNPYIYVSRSRTLTEQGEKVPVIDLSGKQRRIFAPELFFLDDEEGGHWYIYYCADIFDYEKNYPEMAAKYPKINNNHLVFCSRSLTSNPLDGFEDMGPLYCGEKGEIYGANDVTVIPYDGSLFMVWGTLGDNQPMGPAIVEMDNPYTITKDREMLPIGGGEGPRALINKEGKLFITMSEGGYQTDGYRLSLLCYDGDGKEDLLDSTKWTAKRDVFTSTQSVSGPARACFVKSADGTQDWMVYHSRVYKEVGVNSWRQVNIKQFGWNADGTPDFGKAVSPNNVCELPSGDPGQGDMYQAENSILEGGTRVLSDNTNYDGKGYINVPNKMGASSNFVIHAKEAGDYIVGLRYAYGVQKENESTNEAKKQLPEQARMNIYVNGVKKDTIIMDKTSLTWNEWFMGSKRLTLDAGTNLITYTVEKGCLGNVNLDYLTMYKADIPYNGQGVPAPTPEPDNPYTSGTAAPDNASADVLAQAKETDKELILSEQDLIKAIDKDKNKEVEVQINVSDKNVLKKIVLTENVLRKAGETKTNLMITAKDNKGNIQSTWLFDGTALADNKELKDINLVVQVSSIKENGETTVSVAQEGKFPIQGELTINIEGAKTGQKAFIYRKNIKTGKLEELFEGSVKVTDGKVTLGILEGAEYVVLLKKPAASKVTTLEKQVKVSSAKKTLKAGSSSKISISLPTSLQKVTRFADGTKSSAIGAVKVKYQSSNKNTVKIDKNGKLVAVKAGKAIVKTSIILETGKTIVYETAIIVK